ncbi:hypothetical protein JXQ31_06525 [candidate division KSB1 bacterium]|nr:hypothetical protein [candidate division KSB1 bacterium]
MKLNKAYWLIGVFIFYLNCPLFSAGEEIWYTDKGLNAGTNAFMEFLNLFPNIPEKNQVTEIAVKVEFDENTNQTVATQILIKNIGSDTYRPYPVDIPGQVPDAVLKSLIFSVDPENEEDPGLLDTYPKFRRKQAAYLSVKPPTDIAGEKFIWKRGSNESDFKDVVEKINARLGGGLSSDELNNVEEIVMTTNGVGEDRNLVNLSFVFDKNVEKETKVFPGMDVFSVLKDSYIAISITNQLWHDGFHGINQDPPNPWPAKWSTHYYFKRVGQLCSTDKIVLRNDRDQEVKSYTDKELEVLELQSGVNFNYIAQRVMNQAGSDFVRVKLVKNYDVAPYPYNDQAKIKEYKIDSFPLVSFRNCNVIKYKANNDSSTVDSSYAIYEYSPIIEKVNFWDKYFVLSAGTWKPADQSTVENAFIEKSDLLTLGYDKVSIDFGLKNHLISVGSQAGQEEFNYPFVWSGSQAYFMKWKFATGMSDITKIIDEIEFSYRNYNALSNELINEAEQALDNKYFKRNDFVNRRISINNMQFRLSKTIIPEISWGLKIPRVKEIVLAVPFQLPISYRDVRNIGGDNNITGAADYNNNYTYIKSLTGLELNFKFNDNLALPLLNDYYLRNVGISYYHLKEQTNNTIRDGKFYSGQFDNYGNIEFNGDIPEKNSYWFIETRIGYPDKKTGVDQFSLMLRTGLGEKWSQYISAQTKIAGSLWLDIKIVFYQTNSFAYEKVYMMGPVFRINY